MRKFIAVFLLLVFLINLTGVFIAFKIQRSFIRNEVMQLLQQPGFEKELTAITMTAENKHLFEWEHEKEFKYKGVMYDVVKKETNSKGEFILHCIADKKETKLLINLTNLAKKNNSLQEAMKNIVKLLGSTFIPVKKTTVDFFSDVSLIHFCFSASIPFAEKQVASPPPKSV